MMNKVLFNIEEAAEYINMSVPFLRKLVKSGGIKYIRLGYRIMFNKNSIDQWLKEKENENNTSNDDFGL